MGYETKGSRVGTIRRATPTRRAMAAVTVLAFAAMFCGDVRGVRAGDLDPPFVDVKEYTDAAKIVSVRLPQRASVVPTEKGGADALAVFGVDLNKEPSTPQIYLYIWYRGSCASAGLAASAGRGGEWGDLVAGSVERSDGVWTEVRKTAGRRAFVCRLVEHGGAVYEATAQCAEVLFPRLEPHMRALLADFKVTGAVKPPAPPAGYKTLTIDGHELWTNAKRENYERIVKTHSQMFELMRKVLTGPPVCTDPPRIIVCDDDPTFESFAGKDTPFSWVDGRTRALVVRLSRRRDADFAQSVQRASALHFVRNWLGGPSPTWLESGLRMYGSVGAIVNGHFDQPPNPAVNKAKAAAATEKRRLDELFVMSKADAFDRTEIDSTLWAWHWYLRHGPGAETWGPTYLEYIAKLRESGDVEGATELWKDTDFVAMRKAFDEWLPKWKQ